MVSYLLSNGKVGEIRDVRVLAEFWGRLGRAREAEKWGKILSSEERKTERKKDNGSSTSNDSGDDNDSVTERWRS